MTNDPFLSPDGKFWIDPSDGRSVPVVRGGSDTGAPAGEAPPATETAPPAEPAAEPAAPSTEPAELTPEQLKEALSDTRAEAARRRIEAKEAKEQAQKYLDSFAGYTPAEQEQVLAIFKDLADPAKQVAAAQRLADISARLLESEGQTRRPTGEEDPDEKPLTRKEWKELQEQRDQEQANATALKQLESAATEKGYPPDSPGYTVLLSAMMEPDVAGDMDKAVAKVKEYETSIVEAYRQTVEKNGERWPGAPAGGSGTPPADPESGVKPGWGNARAAAAAFLKARVGGTE